MMHRPAVTDEERLGVHRTPFGVQGTPRHLLRWVGAMAFMIVIATGCLGQATEPSLEQQAQEIDKSLMCPVCPSETVDQSQVPLAKQMRAIIREKLATGEPRQQILDFFVERYGEDVLAAPPKTGFNLLAWLMPGAGMLAGVAALVLVLRAMRPSHPVADSTPAVPSPGEELAPYLARVDEELRQVLNRGRSHESSRRQHGESSEPSAG